MSRNVNRTTDPRPRAAITRTVGLLLLAAAALCTAGCDSFFYYPDRVDYHCPLRPGQVAEDVSFEAADGVILHGWFIPAVHQPAIGTVIHFHGNAQNITSHYWFVDWMPEDGFNVFEFDYRGFGQSGLAHRIPVAIGSAEEWKREPLNPPAEPTREGVFQDCVAALRYVKSRPDVDPTRVLGFGQSLGGAAMLGAVGEAEPNFLRGVVVEGSFFNYRGVARRKAEQSWLLIACAEWLPWLIISDAHSPSLSIGALTNLPALFIHGDQDRAVPIECGQALYDAWPGPKHWITAYGVGHLQAREFWSDAYYRDLVGGFFRACLDQPCLPAPPLTAARPSRMPADKP